MLVVLTMAALAWLVPLPAGADVAVSTNIQLAEAIAESNGGAIRLAPGVYDDVIIFRKNPAAVLRITSADPANPAVIRGWVMVDESSNIRIDGLTIDPTSVAAFDDWHQALLIKNSARVVVDNLLIDGHIVQPGEGTDPGDIGPGEKPGAIVGYAYGTGMAIRWSEGVTVTDVTIRRFHGGGFLQNSEDLHLSDLHIHDMRSEGLNLEDLRNVVIEDSRFENFHPWINPDGSDSDHPDMIQFWGANGEYGIQDLTIRNNLFLQGDGGWTQTIFGHLSGGDPNVVTFERFNIHDNVIVNSHLHGISLANVMDSEIHHNLVLPAPGWEGNARHPVIFLRQDFLPASSGNSIHSNVLVAPGERTPTAYFGATSDANDIGSNTILGNRGRPSFFLDVFPNLHDGYTDLPEFALSAEYQHVIGIGHGPRWLNLDGVKYDDTVDSVFFEDILWMDETGITKGCSVDRFCPDDYVTRAQMAAFFRRALGLDQSEGLQFSDVHGSIFAADVELFASAGITRGCGGDRFCPDDFVTRGQMAAFFNRALRLDVGSPSGFDDTARSVFDADIERFSAAGITRGCTETSFCPDDYVTRGQMAAFFHRASKLSGWAVRPH